MAEFKWYKNRELRRREVAECEVKSDCNPLLCSVLCPVMWSIVLFFHYVLLFRRIVLCSVLCVLLFCLFAVFCYPVVFSCLVM